MLRDMGWRSAEAAGLAAAQWPEAGADQMGSPPPPPRSNPDGLDRGQAPFPPGRGRGGSSSSKLRSASAISSNETGSLAPSDCRSEGADSTAQASEAHDDRMARFSFLVRSGSASTS